MIPKYFARTNCARLIGFDNTANAVPERISRASEADALNTALNNPANNVTARTEFFTSLGSSPNAK